jgi:2-polyprenyl-3-methyl-5-hydroxy-6-metoxy-1,4-benzoquinol methylase
MTATDLHFENESFTKVLCFELLEHLTVLQAQKTMNEIYRVLKPGGTIIGSTPLRNNKDSAPATYSHIHEYFEFELKELLNRFEKVETIHNNFFIGGKSINEF